MIITVFEDVEYSSLFPLNINRASFELRCGAFTNLERINNLLTNDDTIQLVVRNDISKLIKERFPHLIINPEIVSISSKPEIPGTNKTGVPISVALPTASSMAFIAAIGRI